MLKEILLSMQGKFDTDQEHFVVGSSNEKWVFSCSGVISGDRWILSAANCKPKNKNVKLYARLGQNTTKSGLCCFDNANRFKVHE